jgi:8-oxo-dGTP diphosphatase
VSPRVGTFGSANVTVGPSASPFTPIANCPTPSASSGRTTDHAFDGTEDDQPVNDDVCSGRAGQPEQRVGSVLRCDVLVDAPPRTVAGVLRDSAVAAEALARHGHRVTAPVRLLAPGNELRVAVSLLGFRIPLRTRITRIDVEGMTSVMAGGPLRALAHVVTLTPGPVGTRMCDELRWTGPLGPLGRLTDRLLVRRAMRRVLAARAEVIAARAEELAAAPAVVATALVRDGRVLVAQRTRPPDLAGRWELPGGRVEPGEDEAAAVVRECREELGTEVVPDGRVGTDLPISVGVLRVHRARLAPGTPEPRALEHAAVRWVDATEAPTVDWVDADRAVVADLVRMLAAER